MNKIIFLLVITFGLLFSSIFSVNALSCAEPPPPKEALEKSSAVFVGKVIDINEPSNIDSENPIRITFEVLTIWKGPDNKKIIVKTPDHYWGPYKMGEEYLIYAYNDEGELTTGLCSRTRFLSGAEEDLKELSDGRTPTNSGSNFVPPISNNFSIILISSVIIVIIGIAIFIIKKYY